MSKHTRGIKTYGGIQMYRGIWTLPQSDKSCFLCVVYVQQASKHLPNTHGGIQTYGSVQTYRGIQTYRGYPNIWGIQTYRWASKHGGIQTYGVYHNIWGHPNIQWVYPNIWGHPSIQGHPNIWGCSYRGHPNIWAACKHTGDIQTYRGVQIYRGILT